MEEERAKIRAKQDEEIAVNQHSITNYPRFYSRNSISVHEIKGTEQFFERKFQSHLQDIERKNRNVCDGSKWENKRTVPKEFHLSQNKAKIKSLVQPVRPFLRPHNKTAISRYKPNNNKFSKSILKGTASVQSNFTLTMNKPVDANSLQTNGTMENHNSQLPDEKQFELPPRGFFSSITK